MAHGQHFRRNTSHRAPLDARTLRLARTLAGWTQKELAHALAIDQTLVSMYENFKRVLPPDVYESAMHALGADRGIFEHLIEGRPIKSDGQAAQFGRNVARVIGQRLA